MTKPSLILLVSMLAACGNVPQTSMKVSQPLDAEFYRQEIVLLDAAVFVNGPLDENHQMEVILGLDRLMRSIRQDDEAPATADTLMEALGNLYALVAAADTGTTTMEKSGIHQEWSRIRSTYFSDADWFRHSPRDPAGDLADVPPLDPVTALQKNGIRAQTALGEALMTLMAIAGAQQKDLRVNKEEELARMERLFTAPSPIDDPHFHLVRSEGLATLRAVRAWMASGYDTVPGSPGRAQVDSLVQHLSAAQDALDEMMKRR